MLLLAWQILRLTLLAVDFGAYNTAFATFCHHTTMVLSIASIEPHLQHLALFGPRRRGQSLPGSNVCVGILLSHPAGCHTIEPQRCTFILQRGTCSVCRGPLPLPSHQVSRPSAGSHNRISRLHARSLPLSHLISLTGDLGPGQQRCEGSQ